MGRGTQIVLAGDPQQLGPIVRSPLASTFGLSVSVLERLMARPVYAKRTDAALAATGGYDRCAMERWRETE